MTKNGLVKGLLAGTFIANLLNEHRKTQSWHVVVYEKGEVRES